MIFLRDKLDKLQPATLNTIAGSLKRGEVVVLPTDTIYGLSARADSGKAIGRIKRLKGRCSDKPLAVLVSDWTMLKKYVFLSPAQEREMRRLVRSSSRPLSFVLPHKSNLPAAVYAGSSGLAVRLPKNQFLIKIIKSVGVPLVSTSLNLSGQEVISDPKRIVQFFPIKSRQPDLVLDAGPCRRSHPSRLLDLRGEGKMRILRK